MFHYIKNHSKIITTCLALILMSSLMLNINQKIYAAGENDVLTMSPAKLQVDIKAGQKYSGTFNIINGGKTDYKFKVYASPYQIKDSNYDNPLFDKENNYTQINRWVTFDKTDYFIKAGETLEVTYHVNTPNNIPGGGQYAVLFAETQPENVYETNGVISKKRAGALLFAHTDGQAIKKSEIILDKIPTFVFSNNIKFKADIKNLGNTDFSGKLKYTLHNIFGGDSTKEKENFILPESTRRIELDFSNQSLFAIYKAKVQGQALDTIKEENKLIIFISPIVIIIAILIVLVLIINKIRKNKHANQKIHY